MKEANVFFSKIDLYKKYKKEPRRAILLYSSPGMGKSATISKLSQRFIEEDPGTVVVFWDTSEIRAGRVGKFLSTLSRFSKKCTRLLFIMEDIGGGNMEDYSGPKHADAGDYPQRYDRYHAVIYGAFLWMSDKGYLMEAGNVYGVNPLADHAVYAVEDRISSIIDLENGDDNV
jgi:hypothetical protein